MSVLQYLRLQEKQQGLLKLPGPGRVAAENLPAVFWPEKGGGGWCIVGEAAACAQSVEGSEVPLQRYKCI